MNVQHYKQRLLDLEKSLSARTGRAVAEARGELIDVAHDVGTRAPRKQLRPSSSPKPNRGQRCCNRCATR